MEANFNQGGSFRNISQSQFAVVAITSCIVDGPVLVGRIRSDGFLHGAQDSRNKDSVFGPASLVIAPSSTYGCVCKAIGMNVERIGCVHVVGEERAGTDIVFFLAVGIIVVA